MISVEEALQLVLKNARPKPLTTTSVVDSLGLVLGEDVASDIDSPPHDKSMVDGYAVRSDDMAAGEAELELLEEVTAGAVPTLPLGAGQTTRIMTGAPVPDGADAVVMVERSELLDDQRVLLRDAVRSGMNIMRRATSLSCGEVVLRRGTCVRAIEVGLLSEVGRVEIQTFARPRVAILSTGNELVPPERRPGPGEIRNSNGPMLHALAAQAGAVPVDLGVSADDRESLETLIRRGLEHDVLVLSGGVSAGVLDLVPAALASCGVQQQFHKVRVKPGKPVWFGTAPADTLKGDMLKDAGGDRLVFGLPGNPVSSLVCFELFVRPAIRQLAGFPEPLACRQTAILKTSFKHRGDRPTWHPSRVQWYDGAWHLEPLAWRGSADQRTLTDANAFACFPAGDREHPADGVVEFIS